MMSLHKLSAGDGYEYLTRQVAANDSTELGQDKLESYYSAQGEAPGLWLGSGLTAFDDINAGDRVTSDQMKALWGEGRHPNADQIEERLIAEGHSAQYALAATKLGTPFKIYDGAPEFTKAVAEAFAAHNEALGENRRAAINPEIRAQIRTNVAHAMFSAEFGRRALDERELSGWIAQKSRPRTNAVAGYDLTFSPVKSVSTLWAVAPREVAERLEAAHRAAVEKTLASLEEHVAYTRIGSNGAARVRAEGLIAAAFTHRDSRAGDPDLHTHVPISNKVHYQGADGIWRWGALDGKPLHRLAVAASEEYNSRLEAEIIAAFPEARFADRDPGVRGKRPVRELVGVSPDLMRRWSARTRAIEDRTSELVAAFQAEHGREPTAVEHIALRQQANLDTREAKHEPRSLADQRTQWHAEAVDQLGSPSALNAMVAAGLGRTTDGPIPVELSAEMRRIRGHLTLTMAPEAAADLCNNTAEIRRRALDQIAQHGPHPATLTPGEAEQYSRIAVEKISSIRSVWKPNHVRAEAMRQARILGIDPDHIEAVAHHITLTALHQHSVQLTHSRRLSDLGEPAVLRDTRGESVFVDRGLDDFTSPAVLAAEQRIIDAASNHDGHRIDPVHVDIALLEQEANKFALNAGQAELVRQFSTAGTRFHLALAPAGTGKTSAMSAFANAWTAAGGTVIGLAPTADAAQVLASDIGRQTDTLDKYAHLVQALRAAADDPDEHARILAAAPEWFTSIGPGTVILIDEVGMASTSTLDPVVAHALAAGADIKAVGDDQQLASVAAGGVLRDVAELGDTLTLREVMRFADPIEGKASLALREGDDEAIGYYVDHQRIHVTADTAAANTAYDAWRADIKAGHASVLLAPTSDTVRALNERARSDRLAEQATTLRDRITGRTSREVTLADGLAASVGDTIRTRRNNRRLRLSSTDFVRNGYRWTIEKVGRDGTITARHERSDARIILPADYVSEHCELGYAGTIHSAQGMTVGSRGKQQGTCHIVGDASLDRQMLYVAMSRGVDANHLYLGTSESDPHKIIYDRAQKPPTAVDMLRTILARDGRQTSASTIARTDTKATTHLAHAADSYATAVGSIAESALGPDVMAAIDNYAETMRPGLTDADGWPTLRKHLAVIAIGAPADRDQADHAAERLHAAIGRRELDTAADPAAVLDWRLDHTGNHSTGPGPLPWLTGIPDTLADHPAFGDYLERRRELVTDLADSVRAESVDTAAKWRQRLPGADDTLVADIAVFRAAHRVDDTDTRPLGGPQPGSSSRREQDRLAARIDLAQHTNSDQERWDNLAGRIDKHLVDDPFWPELSRTLDEATARGLDVEPIIERAASQHALPTEIPAAALYWRAADDLAADPVQAARATLDDANMRLADHRLTVLAATVGADTTAVWAQHPDRDDLTATLAAAHANTGMQPQHLVAAAGRGRDVDALTTTLRGMGTVTDPRPEPVALPGDNPADVDAAQAAHAKYLAAVDVARRQLDQTPPAWLDQLGARPTNDAAAQAWDTARDTVMNYHAEYGVGDEPIPALPDDARPAQARAHEQARARLDELDRKRRQEHLDRLADLEQQHQQQLDQEHRHEQFQHMPPPAPHHQRGRHL